MFTLWVRGGLFPQVGNIVSPPTDNVVVPPFGNTSLGDLALVGRNTTRVFTSRWVSLPVYYFLRTWRVNRLFRVAEAGRKFCLLSRPCSCRGDFPLPLHSAFHSMDFGWPKLRRHLVFQCHSGAPSQSHSFPLDWGFTVGQPSCKA